MSSEIKFQPTSPTHTNTTAKKPKINGCRFIDLIAVGIIIKIQAEWLREKRGRVGKRYSHDAAYRSGLSDAVIFKTVPRSRMILKFSGVAQTVNQVIPSDVVCHDRNALTVTIRIGVI
jgi:hypothetical protein